MTWPVEWGGGGRTVLERFVVTETLIAKGAPIAGSWFADRQMGPSLLAYGTEEQKKQFLPGIIAGETGWCIGMSEPDAGSDLASLRTRAIRDGDEFVIDGQKIWTSFGETAELLLPDLPHLDRRAAPRRHQRADRAARLAGHHDQPDQGHDHQPPLLRGVLRGRAGAGGEPRRRGGRVVEADDAPARARARRHRPPAVELRALPASLAATPTRATRSCVRRSPRSRSGYRIGRLLVLREVHGAGAEVVLGRDEDVLHRARAARRGLRRRRSRARTRWCGDGSRRGSATPPRTRSWAAPRTCCATSSGNGCWAFPGNPEHPPRGVAEV